MMFRFRFLVCATNQAANQREQGPKGPSDMVADHGVEVGRDAGDASQGVSGAQVLGWLTSLEERLNGRLDSELLFRNRLLGVVAGMPSPLQETTIATLDQPTLVKTLLEQNAAMAALRSALVTPSGSPGGNSERLASDSAPAVATATASYASPSKRMEPASSMTPPVAAGRGVAPIVAASSSSLTPSTRSPRLFEQAGSQRASAGGPAVRKTVSQLLEDEEKAERADVKRSSRRASLLGGISKISKSASFSYQNNGDDEVLSDDSSDEQDSTKAPPAAQSEEYKHVGPRWTEVGRDDPVIAPPGMIRMVTTKVLRGRTSSAPITSNLSATADSVRSRRKSSNIGLDIDEDTGFAMYKEQSEQHEAERVLKQLEVIGGAQIVPTDGRRKQSVLPASFASRRGSACVAALESGDVELTKSRHGSHSHEGGANNLSKANRRLGRPVDLGALKDLLAEAESVNRNLIWKKKHFPYVFVPPTADVLNGWSLAILVLVLLQSVTVPLETCFDVLVLGTVGEAIVLAIFVLDLCLNFFAAFPDDHGDLVFDWRRIAARYIFSVWFAVDALSVFPFGVLANHVTFIRQTKMIKIFKLMRMVRLGKVARPSIRTQKMAKTGVQLLKLLLVVMLLMHWVSCGWNLAGDHWRCFGSLQLRVVQFDDDEADALCDEPPLLSLYTACLFQACRNLFGDGEAFTKSEQIYFAIVTILGAIMQASVLGSVANLLRSFDEDRHNYERKLEVVRHKMEFLRVPERLQDRVLEYYDKQWQFHKSVGETAATEFIEELSRPLQMDLKINLFKPLLIRVPFLQAVDTVVAEELVLRLDMRTFMKGEMVMRKGDPGDSIGFISRGLIAVLDPRDGSKGVSHKKQKDKSQGSVIRLLRKASCFGEVRLAYCLNAVVLRSPSRVRDIIGVNAPTARRGVRQHAHSFVRGAVMGPARGMYHPCLHARRVHFARVELHADAAIPVCTYVYRLFHKKIGTQLRHSIHSK